MPPPDVTKVAATASKAGASVETEQPGTLEGAGVSLRKPSKTVPGSQRLTVTKALQPVAETAPLSAVPTSLQLSTPGPETEIEEEPDFIQTTGRSGNVTWGEKHGKTGDWKERWLTQLTDENNNSFGRASGEDLDARRTWDVEWQRTQHTTNLVRRVTQYDNSTLIPENPNTEEFQSLKNLPDSAVIEVWEENTVHDDRTGIQQETVFGTDRRQVLPRQWRRMRKVLKARAEDESDIVLSTITQEINRPEKRGYEEVISADHRETKFVETYENEETREIWRSEWTERADDKKEGTKCGVNAQNEKWKEEWSETPTGKTIKKWKENDDGSIKWGVTTGWTIGSDGVREEFTEHWNKEQHEITLDDGTTALREEELADKWWIRPDNNRWGEKARQITVSKEGQQQAVKSCRELRERWYDNGTEKKTDQWAVEKTFDDEGNVIQESHEGHVDGERYADGTHWGENWGEEFLRPVKDEKEETAEIDNKHTATESQTPQARPAEGLVSVVRHDDKWWQEGSGNSWGEKCYQAKLEDKKVNEKWYKNPEGENQVDRWCTESGGSQSGIKFGSKWEDGELVSWKEHWGEESAGNKWIEKSWEKAREGQITTSWGESSRSDVRDDGLGNIEVCKTGTKRRDGIVVDWFVDRYGECLGVGEKWAFKEGADADDNHWTEKWNETKDYKTAEKSGRNACGDEWSEKWAEDFNAEGGKDRTWASKSGKNARGDAWHEEWVETAQQKWTKKIGSNAGEGTQWEESWGEEYNPDGGAKWTSKHASNPHGKWGQSWGDRWTSQGGHRWGEEWSSGGGDNQVQVHKWAYDTDAGDHPDNTRT